MAEGNKISLDHLVERLAPKPGERWLDVATGTGAVALRAARAGAQVTGIDLAPALIETAKRLAADEGLAIRYDVGDAEALPYDDASFDVVSSSFGVIFAADQESAAHELARVCRSGGRLGLACLNPDGQLFGMLELMERFLPRPPGAAQPLDWGREDNVRELLGEWFDVELQVGKPVPAPPRSPEEQWEFLVSSFGPIKYAADAMEDEERAEFREAYLEIAARGTGERRPYVLVLGRRR